MIYKQVQSEKLTLSMKKFVDEFNPKQEADKAFQANQFTRWTPEQASSYMTSTIRGMAPSKFIFCDVKKCLEYAQDQDSVSDVEYYSRWLYDEGVEYLNLDSNNRVKNSIAFVNNEIAIEASNYFIGTNLFNIEEGKNDTYEKLPETVKEAWDTAEIDLHIYTNATRDELSEIFTRINDGKPLNEPEKRNASTSHISNVVRDLAEKYSDIFFRKNTKWFTPDQQNRRGLDDFVAGMAFVQFYGLDKAITPNSLFQMYRVGKLESLEINLFKKRFETFMDYMIDEFNAIPNRNSIFDLWYIFLQQIDKREFIIKEKMKEFITHYAKVVGDLLRDPQTYTVTKGDPKSFETMIGGRQAINNQKRNELILNNLNIKDYFIKMDTRSITDNSKLAVAARDNFKTPEGKDIDLSKLMTGKYHKGHIDAYANTGITSIENSVIQEDKDNLSLGRNKVKIA
jgi:hypothetical protein